jgi:hypothetical protein
LNILYWKRGATNPRTDKAKVKRNGEKEKERSTTFFIENNRLSNTDTLTFGDFGKVASHCSINGDQNY